MRGSLILNVTGGLVAGVLLIALLAIQRREQWNIPRSALLSAVVAVTLGIFIVMGVALAFQRTGVAAGIATLFLGQMIIGVVVDALG